MLSLITLAIAPALVNAPVDNVKLARTYSQDEVQTYSLDVNANAGGQEMILKTEVVFKVRKKSDSGAEVAMSVRKFSLLEGGNDAGRSGPDEMTTSFDKYGMPSAMSTNNEAWVYLLAAMAGLVPGKEVVLGESFGVNWEAGDKVLKTSGKGKAVEVVDRDGVKAVKLEYELEVTPGDESPGHVKCVTYVSQDTASPISCEGSVEVEGGTIKFNVKRVKA